ncbi:MAG TPA: hypothetical protein VHV30_07775 [Polyangiaceae bacterium]|nr:hypothetical protein [Polyangiaceae bacterium]
MPRFIPGAALGALVCLAFVSTGGCLDRPVAATHPVTRTNLTAVVNERPIDKIDLLFDIDNSASMGDKQDFLVKAVPDLLSRLVTPECLDAGGNWNHTSVGADGTCAMGRREFAPIQDMHIGILSSSLGSRLSTAGKSSTPVCPPSGVGDQIKFPSGMVADRHNDDQGRLLDRSGNAMSPDDEATYRDVPLGAADPNHFLDWFPAAASGAAAPIAAMPAVTSVTDLQNDFEGLVAGVHQFGCGVESQLESWYRFLIQPDPYASLSVDSAGRAQWDGVDTTILEQRAAFLRPDSLVAVIVLSDEDDSEIDVRALGGQAWQFMQLTFGAPHPTSACASNPNDPSCTSCGLLSDPSSDPNCSSSYNAQDDTDWAVNLNLRHVHMKQKYGVDVQFPIQRYVMGLTSPSVPDRGHEYPKDEGGNYPSYQGLTSHPCVNPLYAAELPVPPAGTDPAKWDPNADELCNLTPGTRQPRSVFYAHIGGVPHQLLQQDPMMADSPQKDTLSDADWKLILGADPEKLDTTGIDPHMVEDFQPRTGAAMPTGGFPVFPATANVGADPINGREWVTKTTQGVDLEYACTFKLAQPRDCSNAANDEPLSEECDCDAVTTGGGIPAVCNQSNPQEQDFAKAYPTIRELLLAKLLGQVDGANAGIVSSLCPIHTTEQGTGDPLFGYRPAMTSIVNELRNALGPQCLPEKLDKTGDAGAENVSCLILGTFPPGDGAPTKCTDVPGYAPVDSPVLDPFLRDNPMYKTYLTCALNQLPANSGCGTGSTPGWCYEDDGSTGKCPQSISFSSNALVKGVVTNLTCLEASTTSLDDAGTDAGK